MNHKDTSMSNDDDSVMSTDMKIDHGNSKNMANMSKDTDNNSNANETSTIVTNIASYQTAKELTKVAIELFNSTIKQNISNATDNANAIESSLHQLEDLIESKEPYDKVMGIIHGPIQTNTQEAFKLPLKNLNDYH